MASQGTNGFNFEAFQKRLDHQTFKQDQKDLLETRLELLKDFVRPATNPTKEYKPSKKPDFAKSKKGKAKEREWENGEHAKRQAAIARKDTWSFEAGSLTIVVSGPSRPALSSRRFAPY